MKAIILAARGITNLPSSVDLKTNLSWIINSMREAGIEDINIVGGKNIEDLKIFDKDIKIIYNNMWNDTGPLESLLLYEKIICESDTIISFADTIYTKSVVKNFIDNLGNSQIEILSDKNWQVRYSRDIESISKAEKIYLDSGKVVNATRRELNLFKSSEYTGICFISKEIGPKIVEVCKDLINNELHSKKVKYGLGFMELFSMMIDRKYEIVNQNISGSWAEFDNPSDFHNFIFGTKSKTLANLKGQLEFSKILPQISFTVEDWQHNQEPLISKIQSYFKSDRLVVRSSSLSEDTINESMAGKFTSVLNVNKDKSLLIIQAIDDVIDSYGDKINNKDVVFIQPHLKNVQISGVAFTCDLKSGAPYFCINYTKSRKTDLVTSGSGGDYRLFYHFKDSRSLIKNVFMRKLVKALKEIENLTDNQMLDVEFAFDSNDKLYIFQVRPIVNSVATERYGKYKIDKLLDNEYISILDKFSTKSEVSGDTNILGKMPDWNPAELIGDRPSPLSYSLYDSLITKKIWRMARGKIGYYNPKSTGLSHLIFGQPFIDVRNSINSFSPVDLPKTIRKKLTDEAILFLGNNRHLHDKLEFDVATTCYTPYFFSRKERWIEFGFKDSEIKKLEFSFRKHTLKILKGEFGNCDDFVEVVEDLDKKREKIIENKDIDNMEKVKMLHEICSFEGTLPFSILARYAFIGTTFLKSFVDCDIISKKSYNLYLNSIETIATNLSEELENVRQGETELSLFLSKFGHLRPGTFDINSVSYSEDPNNYFDFSQSPTLTSPISSKNFKFNKQELKKIDALLKELNLSISSSVLLEFIEESIKSREYSKFIFSRTVSNILELLISWGDENNISRSDLSFLDINILINIDLENQKISNVSFLKKYIEIQKETFEKNKSFLLPDLIVEPDDILSFFVTPTNPNFITDISTSGNLLKLNSDSQLKSLKDRIVMIESADPGYDWIFTRDIKGLITKYGGAASHMAIRCAEFNLPAAIGCGEIFDDFLSGDMILLDCSNKLIRKL